MKTADEKWLTGMDGISLSDAYVTDLFDMWIQRPIPQWRTQVDSNYLPTDAHQLTNLGCLLSVRSVNLYNVETDKNVIEIQYLSSGPSREKLVILNAVRRRQIPANWIESSGDQGMGFGFRFEPSVGRKAHVLLSMDNPTARSQVIETGATQWKQIVTEKAIARDHEFFRKFQLYGYEPLRVTIDGKTLIQDPSLETIFEKARSLLPPKKRTETIWSGYHPPGDWHQPFNMNPTQWRKAVRNTWIPDGNAERDPTSPERGDVRFQILFLNERGVTEPSDS